MSTNAIVREPPHSDEAELAVLAGVCWRNEALDQVVDQLKEEDFYRTAHRHIFSAMLSLHQKREPIDLISLNDELATSGKLDAVGGPEFLAKLVDTSATSANIVYYAQKVFERALLRRLINASHEILAEAYSSSRDTGDIVEDAERAILEVAERKSREGVVPLPQIIHESLQHLNEIVAAGGQISGVPSGFHDLDKLTSGFQKGDLVIIASRPGMGKTAFALNLATQASAKWGGGKTVLFFSMEMPRMQLGLRMICSASEIDLSAMRNAQIIETSFDRLTKGAGELYESKLYIDDTGNLSLSEIRAKARRLKAEHGLDMVIIDYIQLMASPKGTYSREQEISKISRGLKLLAKELNIPVLALAQLNRMVEQRTNKRPVPSDLRESGALEQDADLIIFIYRDEVYNQDQDDNRGVAEIHLAKHRNGKPGKVVLEFQAQFARFRNKSFREDVPMEALEVYEDD